MHITLNCCFKSWVYIDCTLVNLCQRWRLAGTTSVKWSNGLSKWTSPRYHGGYNAWLIGYFIHGWSIFCWQHCYRPILIYFQDVQQRTCIHAIKKKTVIIQDGKFAMGTCSCMGIYFDLRSLFCIYGISERIIYCKQNKYCSTILGLLICLKPIKLRHLCGQWWWLRSRRTFHVLSRTGNCFYTMLIWCAYIYICMYGDWTYIIFIYLYIYI